MTGFDYSTPANMQLLCTLAIKAGINAMRHYEDGVQIQTKADDSPVTLADQEGEVIITQGIQAAHPNVQIIGEETFNPEQVTQLEPLFFLLDPLDGTKEFINKKTDFTVNIGLIENTQPVAGVVYAPAKQQLFFTLSDAAYQIDIAPTKAALDDFDIAKAKPITTRKPDAAGLTVVASHSHRTAETDDYLETIKVKELISAGSSLKFCLLAAGEADLYPRFGRTMEWDTAAADAVLRRAGGIVENLDGAPLTYGKLERGLDNPFFIART